MKLDSTHRLAYDRSLFVSMRGVDVHVLPVKKHPLNPLLVPDKPWEEDVHIYGSVLYIDGMYKMWYYARTESYAVRMTCYAQSADGIHWEKPELDVAEYRGMKTNIVFGTPVMGDAFEESDTVLYTPWDTGREYKMLYAARAREHAPLVRQVQRDNFLKQAEEYRRRGDHQMELKLKERAGRVREDPATVFVAYSSDGIHWRRPEAPAVPAINDISHMMYDDRTKEYRIYGRGFLYDEGRVAKDRDQPFFDGYLGRAILLSQSGDGVVWSEGKPIYAADFLDRPGDEIYSMAVFPWAGRYLGLVQMYHGAPDDMTLDIQLAISADGEHFERVGDRNPLIPLSGAGGWDRFNTCIASVPFLKDGQVWLYFNGAVFRHLRITGSCEYQGADTWDRIVRIGLGTCLPDRFACARASFSSGRLITVPLEMACPVLHINGEAAWGRLEISVTNGEKTYEASIVESGGDVPLALPGWVVGAPVTISFTLKNAALYSFWCAQD